MSHLGGDKSEEPEFKWLKERADGKRSKAAKFYESFAYDGIEYHLYDTVCLHVESEQAPYIGKLINIWEEANKSRKIRVQWFFRPSEISYYLGDTEVLENELFLASGCGTGLADINVLETLAGKCNVVCISSDDRNPRRSENDIKMADYVFYRIFDVQSCMILDQFDGTIGELEVEFVFNKKEGERTLDSPKAESNKDGARDAIAYKEAQKFVCESSLDISIPPNGDCNYMIVNNDINALQASIAKEELCGDTENGPFIEVSTSGLKSSNVDLNLKKEEIATSDVVDKSALGALVVGCKVIAKKVKVKERMSPSKQIRLEVKFESDMKSHGASDASLKSGKLDDTLIRSKDKNVDLMICRDRQETCTIESKSFSTTEKNGCKVNIEGDKVKDGKCSVKKARVDRTQTNMRVHCMNDTFLKRGKLDGNSLKEKGKNVDENSSKATEVVTRMENKRILSVKNVKCRETVKYDMHPNCLTNTSSKSEVNDISPKDNSKAIVSCSIFSGGTVSMNSSNSCDAKFEFGTISCSKTLGSECFSHSVPTQKDLKVAKSCNAPRGNSSRFDDVLVDKTLKIMRDDDFERYGQVAKQVELSSGTANESSKSCVYPSNVVHGSDSFSRKDLSMVKDSCRGQFHCKEVKGDNYCKLGEEDNTDALPNLENKHGLGHDAKHAMHSGTLAKGTSKRCSYSCEGKTNHGHGACGRKDIRSAKGSRIDEGPSKKVKVANLSKTSELNKYDSSQDLKEKIHAKEDEKVGSEIFEVNPRPMIEKRTWLKKEKLLLESMKITHNEGTLVLLQNLDPTLVSAEVQDIIWHTFQVECQARMIQHTAISSPHNGRALLIFNTREDAESIVKKLDEKCLMLLNQGPLVGYIVLLPELSLKQTAFVGHLSIDKVKRAAQRKVKEAVSTSHSPQPNTIEYEMAMEWCFLQAKSAIWWQNLFERQKEKLENLTANLAAKLHQS